LVFLPRNTLVVLIRPYKGLKAFLSDRRALGTFSAGIFSTEAKTHVLIEAQQYVKSPLVLRYTVVTNIGPRKTEAAVDDAMPEGR
jgi:hypothetical protein